eukprot:6685207-Prymnesium_polylepis.1
MHQHGAASMRAFERTCRGRSGARRCRGEARRRHRQLPRSARPSRSRRRTPSEPAPCLPAGAR